jgi:D-beta-D-heptose 7-phosphate kinase/D-beta-D-heptose 1-phosphate adenosyltransferase
MPDDLSAWIDRWAGRRVLVVGDGMLDRYLEGTSGRLCREAPVPSVTLSRRLDAPGGSANTAVNVHGLGGRVHYLTVLGDDLEGAFLRRTLEQRGVNGEHVLLTGQRHTLAKHRVMAAAQILLRFDEGDTGSIPPDVEEELLARLHVLWPTCDAVIVSDYGYGLITPAVLDALAELQASQPRVVVADSRHRLAAFRRIGVTAVKPNFEEFVELLGARDLETLPSRLATVAGYGDEVLERTGARMAAVTLDREGALLFERGRPPYRTYAPPARHSCVAGAGDTFVSALTLALAAGASREAAGELAAAAAAVVIGKDGTATCSAAELREYVLGGPSSLRAGPAPLSRAGKLIPDLSRLAARAEYLRSQGKRLVFTNGCFDILHAGHISHLHHAKTLGDVLIVGLNSDAGVRRLKGPGRPINRQEDRVQVLAALECIDHIVPFDADTACDLVRVIRPEVFVKGGDYTPDRLPEAPLVRDLGGVVEILPYLPECSTSSLIERIFERMKEEGGRMNEEPSSPHGFAALTHG